MKKIHTTLNLFSYPQVQLVQSPQQQVQTTPQPQPQQVSDLHWLQVFVFTSLRALPVKGVYFEFLINIRLFSDCYSAASATSAN